jgi:hypothetical protein
MDSETSIPPRQLQAEIRRGGVPLSDELPWEVWRALFTEHIGGLLRSDFNQLLSLLYRVDVEEKKLRRLLEDRPTTDAAVLITDAIITRVREKMVSRLKYKPSPPRDEEERW